MSNEHLIAEALPMATSIASKMYARFSGQQNIELDDLIGEAHLAVVEAADRYDASKNVKFTTYIYRRVAGAIYRHIAQRTQTVKIPENLFTIIRKVYACETELTQELQREPSTAEIAAKLGLTEDQVIEALQLGEPRDKDIADKLPTIPHNETGSILEEVYTAISQLPKLQQQIITMRYGLDGQPAVSLSQISDTLGLTRRNITQHERAAMSYIRHPAHYK